MTNDKILGNPVLKLSIEFSVEIISYCEILMSLKHYVLSNQLLKSATSIGANAMEAQNAESPTDFIHKFKIAAKEADEAQYWLLLCKYIKELPDSNPLLVKLLEIQKVIGKIISSTKNRINSPK